MPKLLADEYKMGWFLLISRGSG